MFISQNIANGLWDLWDYDADGAFRIASFTSRTDAHKARAELIATNERTPSLYSHLPREAVGRVPFPCWGYVLIGACAVVGAIIGLYV